MNANAIQTLTTTFEAHAQQAEGGVEYWLARDIQHLLGYAKWENFLQVIAKAKTACEVSERKVADHFPDVRKMVDLGSGSRREVDDVMLTRYACYLIAQNGDPRKPDDALLAALLDGGEHVGVVVARLRGGFLFAGYAVVIGYVARYCPRIWSASHTVSPER